MAVFEQVCNLPFINRFGEEVVHPRRCYRYRDRSGGVAPLDVKLGIDGCFGFSPLLTFLICMLGADESYARAAQKLEAVLGFKVSSAAVQRTTEKTGERIPDDPTALIGEQRQRQPCSLMVVEVDGTTSPQITEHGTGRGYWSCQATGAEGVQLGGDREALGRQGSRPVDGSALRTTPGVRRVCRAGRAADGLPGGSTTDQAWKQINYFTNNQERMDYPRYREARWPVGSGLVEGQCKFVVGRRFKGNGMRWRPRDNRCVLRTRLALLNGDLRRYFSPPDECEIKAA